MSAQVRFWAKLAVMTAVDPVQGASAGFVLANNGRHLKCTYSSAKRSSGAPVLLLHDPMQMVAVHAAGRSYTQSGEGAMSSLALIRLPLLEMPAAWTSICTCSIRGVIVGR